MLISMHKRSFMLGTAATLAAPLAMAASPCRPALGAQAVRLDWQAYVGEHFELTDEQGRRRQLQLAGISAAAAAQPGCEQFSLCFAAASGSAPPAGLYRLEHADGQQAPLYLSEGLRADFNLLQSARG